MKRPNQAKRTNGVIKRKRTQRSHGQESGQINELLKICLEKVCELQKDLERTQDLEDDPQAAGYAACAVEALNFLSNEGIPPDHPMVKVLREKLLQ